MAVLKDQMLLKPCVFVPFRRRLTHQRGDETRVVLSGERLGDNSRGRRHPVIPSYCHTNSSLHIHSNKYKLPVLSDGEPIGLLFD